MKKISIIIPFSAYKHYLKECFKSLTTSSYQDFEVLLVLDHPQEDLSKLIDKYDKLLDLKVLSLGDNQHGVACARNCGIKAASGEFIYFLDSDDYLLDNTLEELVKAIRINDDLVYGIINNTWNNKANFLEKKANREIDEDDEEEKENSRLENIRLYQEALPKDCNLEKEMAIYQLMKKRKGFRKYTVLGNLYRLAFIKEHQLSFNEAYRYYSDMTFITPYLDQLQHAFECREAIYVKRKHNDPINEPALWQEDSDQRFLERCEAVKDTRDRISVDGTCRYQLDCKLVNFYVYNMGRKLRRSQDDIWRNEYFNVLAPYIAESRSDVVSSMRRWKRNMVKALLDQDIDKAQKVTRFRLGKKKFKKMFHNKNVLYKLAYFHIFMKKPLRENAVMFESFLGKNYSDSPKYIYEYLAANYGDRFECIWVLNNQAKPPYKAKVVKRFSFRYAYYLATSKYLVFNVRQPLWYRKKEGQVFIETWHGTPLKRLVFDQEEVTSASPKYKQQFYRQRLEWDYLVSANPFSTKTFHSCFMYDGKYLEYGYPRNDLLYAPNRDEIAANLKKQLGIPADKKTILYAPTWRDDEHYGKGEYKFTLALDLKLLKEQLQDDYVLILRTHHYIADNIDTTGLEGFVYNLSKYDDITEIYLISDICITDYSSVFFDYANLKRPVLFYTYDIEKYKNQLRGFYISMQEEVPGPLLYTSEEVLEAIKHIDQIQSDYQQRYEEFYQRFCCYDDGHASQHIVEEVFLGMKHE